MLLEHSTPRVNWRTHHEVGNLLQEMQELNWVRGGIH